jgi:glucose-1-phosphatase
MIKTILCDIGNVLLFFSYPRMLRQVGEACGLHEDEVYYTIVERNLGEMYERGEISTEDLLKHFANISTRAHTKEQFCEAISNIFMPNSSMVPIISSLKEQGFKLVLLSNTCEAHFEYMQRKYPVLKHFDEAVLSYRVKARKPDREIFEKAILTAGCEPHEIFYTDDVHEYVAVARQLGIDAEQYINTQMLISLLRARGIKGL